MSLPDQDHYVPKNRIAERFSGLIEIALFNFAGHGHMEFPHRNLTTTQRYAHNSESDLKNTTESVATNIHSAAS